jgi:hypothetical protein
MSEFGALPGITSRNLSNCSRLWFRKLRAVESLRTVFIIRDPVYKAEK